MNKVSSALCFGAIILCLALLALSLLSTGTNATDADIEELSMPAIFSDGMVLQRDENIGIYGYSVSEGGTITATLGDCVGEGTVTNGRFDISLPPMAAAKGPTLTVKDEALGKEKSFSNVDIGEVWHLCGQSNINYPVHQMEDYEEYRSQASLYPIRAFIVPSMQETSENDMGYGEWFDVNSTTLFSADKNGLYLSAIGYVMATRISLELGEDVTIALIDSTYPGSSIQPWIDEGIFAERFGSYHSDIYTLSRYHEFYLENDRMPTAEDELSWFVGKPYQKVLSVTYNAMTHFLDGYTVRGSVWYQGESNIGAPNEYPELFAAYSETVRTTFRNDSLPIYMIELAPYNSSLNAFQCVQYEIADSDPYTYLIPTGYEGTVFSPDDFKQSGVSDLFVHAARKSPIGLRLASAVLRNTYGQEDIAIGARLLSICAEEYGIVLTFDTPLSLMYGDRCEGFKLAASGGSLYDAEAVIDGCRVILNSDKVSTPTRVSYGCGSFFLELEDGSYVYPAPRYEGSSNTKTWVYLVDIDGNTYNFTDGDVLRSRFPGNLTNSSGEPVAIFELEVGYVCEEVEK